MIRIYESQNHILIHTENIDPAEHSHMAAHVMISLKNPMRVTADGGEYLCRGIMIPSGVTHKIETYGNPVLVFLYDSTTNVAERIRKVSELQETQVAELALLYEEFEKETSKTNYRKIESSLLKLLGIEDIHGNVIDERIVSAMEYVRKQCTEKLVCREVADMVHLSEGRFSHLFKEQAGMTFAAYVICQRILKVYTDVIQGKTVTEAAIDAGFSSSAHFADVNRRVFGISIRCLIKNLSYTKIT